MDNYSCGIKNDDNNRERGNTIKQPNVSLQTTKSLTLFEQLKFNGYQNGEIVLQSKINANENKP